MKSNYALHGPRCYKWGPTLGAFLVQIHVWVGSLLWVALVLGASNAQGQIVTAPATVASSPSSPKTALQNLRIELLKEKAIAGTSIPMLYSADPETSRNLAQGTYVVVPAERANSLLKYQTDVITNLSERLRVIEIRLEALEKSKGLKK